MGNLRLNDDVAIHFGISFAIGCACLITLNCMLILIYRSFFHYVHFKNRLFFS